MKKKAGRSKYNAVREEVEGIVFHSKKEAKRFKELKLLQRMKQIQDLRLQVAYDLLIPTKYVADFVYWDRLTGRQIVEDVKGYRTAEYRRKKRYMKQQHNIDIKEI